MKTRVFKVEEANAILPTITPIVRELQKHQRKAGMLEHELCLSRMAAEYRIAMSSENNLDEKRNQFNRHIININLLITRIQSYGCLVKDIEMGLVDFLAELDDRPIFLSWKLGEPEITYYHDLDESFEERKHIWFI